MRSFRLGLRQFRDNRVSFDRSGAIRAVQEEPRAVAKCRLARRATATKTWPIDDRTRDAYIEFHRHATPARPYSCPLIQTICDRAFLASLSSRSLITLLFSPLPPAESTLAPSFYAPEHHCLLPPSKSLFQSVGRTDLRGLSPRDDNGSNDPYRTTDITSLL